MKCWFLGTEVKSIVQPTNENEVLFLKTVKKMAMVGLWIYFYLYITLCQAIYKYGTEQNNMILSK
jgi:hypothetical protein